MPFPPAESARDQRAASGLLNTGNGATPTVIPAVITLNGGNLSETLNYVRLKLLY
jgi:hypothetical protein